MPYRTSADLPASVRAHLPDHAQDVYHEAFNHAFAAHAGEGRQEEAAHRIAWAAVKRRALGRAQRGDQLTILIRRTMGRTTTPNRDRGGAAAP